jgi:hypothetical protein
VALVNVTEQVQAWAEGVEAGEEGCAASVIAGESVVENFVWRAVGQAVSWSWLER